MKPRWAVMISGRGSNLASLLEYREEIDIRLVVSSRADAPGVFRAKRAGVPTAVTPITESARAGTKKIDWDATIALIESVGADHLFLAGFMKLVPARLIERFSPGRIVNLHPSLLPAYPGLNSIERAYVDRHDLGCTVHEVIEQVDSGRVLCQRRTLRSEDLGGGARAGFDAASAEFLVHVDEQRIVREVLRRWRRRA